MLSKTTTLGLLLTLLTSVYSQTNIEPPQITNAPSHSEYTSALAYHSLLLDKRAPKPPSSSLGSADALTYCQESEHGCSAQLTLFDNCSAKYSGDLKYLYCLCTTGYHDAVSACDACSASLGAIPWGYVSSDVVDAKSQCESMEASYGGNTHTGTTTKGGSGGGGHGSKTTTTARAEATSVLPSSTTTTSSFHVTMPTDPYAGLAGQPTIPGDNGVAAATSSGAAATNKGVGMVAGMVLGLGGAVLL